MSRDIPGRIYGTQVNNPTRQSGRPGYSQCSYCQKWYTQLGISRHWGKCPKKPRPEQEEMK